MAQNKRQQNELKAKQKRQKIFVAVGGVLLLGVLAFQVPRTLKMLHPSNPAASAPTTPAATTPTDGVTPPADGSLAPPTLSGGGTSPTSPVAGGALASSDPTPTPQSDQLVSFDRFASKDPFSQQLGPGSPSATTPTTTTPTPTPVPPSPPEGAVPP